MYITSFQKLFYHHTISKHTRKFLPASTALNWKWDSTSNFVKSTVKTSVFILTSIIFFRAWAGGSTAGGRATQTGSRKTEEIRWELFCHVYSWSYYNSPQLRFFLFSLEIIPACTVWEARDTLKSKSITHLNKHIHRQIKNLKTIYKLHATEPAGRNSHEHMGLEAWWGSHQKRS